MKHDIIQTNMKIITCQSQLSIHACFSSTSHASSTCHLEIHYIIHEQIRAFLIGIARVSLNGVYVDSVRDRPVFVIRKGEVTVLQRLIY